MSGQATGWVMRYGPKDRAMRAVLLTIADAANRDGEGARPGIAAMVEGSLYQKSHVSRVVTRLVDEGWVEITEQGNGRGNATVYRVIMDRPETSPPVDGGRRNLPIGEEKPPHLEQETSPSSDSVPLFPTVIPNGKEQPPRTAVEQVFDAWKASTKKTAATVLDPKRRALIIKALATYPIADVLDAVRGWEHSAHHRGENDGGTVYNDLGLLLRDAGNIERFRDLARGPRQSGKARPRTADSAIAEDPSYWEEP